jgi:hypothetical protein
MTDRDTRRSDHPDDERPATIIVPGASRRADELSDGDLLTEAQQVQDLGSASRSCVAIIAILLIMALLVCVFLFWALVIR